MIRKWISGAGKLIAGSLLLFSLVLAPPQAIAATPNAGSSPSRALVLEGGETSAHLPSGEAIWYLYEPQKRGGTIGQVGSLTLIFTPAVSLGDHLSRVNFGIFSSGQVTSGKDIMTVPPIGMGGYVSRDGDHNTGEAVWRGSLQVPDTYYVRVHNDTSIDIDFWLFTDDMMYPELGCPNTAVSEVTQARAGSAPSVALTMSPGVTIKARLGLGEALWYNLVPPDYGYDGGDSDHSFTLFFTPGYALNANHVGFEIMTPEQRLLRERGNIHLNTGAGTIVSRDGDELTGERL